MAAGDSGLSREISYCIGRFLECQRLTMSGRDLKMDSRGLFDDSISSVAFRHLAFHRASVAFWADQSL